MNDLIRKSIEYLTGLMDGCKTMADNGIFTTDITGTREVAESLKTAIRSLEAWDEVIKHLETTISEIKSTEMDQDCKMFCQGLTFAVRMIKKHLKEVKK